MPSPHNVRSRIGLSKGEDLHRQQHSQTRKHHWSQRVAVQEITAKGARRGGGGLGVQEIEQVALTSMKGLMVSREASVVPVMGRLNLLSSSSRNTTLAVKQAGRLLVKVTLTGSFSLAMPIRLPSGNSKVNDRCCCSGSGRICGKCT